MIDPAYSDDARCELCNTNLDDWRHMTCAPCPATTQPVLCAACCAASDSSCEDCLSVLVAPYPPVRARHELGTPHDQQSTGRATPLAGSCAELGGTEAATTGVPGCAPVVAAPHNLEAYR